MCIEARCLVRYAGLVRYDDETHQYHCPSTGNYVKVNALPKIPIAMVTWRFQNGCIFARFLRYFKFPSVKVSKNLMLDLEYETIYRKNRKNCRMSFYIFAIFCSE